MAGFLYFIPSDKPHIDRSYLIKIGFPFYDNAVPPGAQVMRGPKDQPGFVMKLQGQTNATAEEPKPLGYYPNDQQWQCAGAYWIGWLKKSPPRPQDLERRAVVGHPVKLRDGNTWIVPPVRQATGGSALPNIWCLDDAGNNVTKSAPEYDDLWTKACQLYDVFFGVDKGESAVEISFDESLCMAAKAIGMNYFLGEKEMRAREMCMQEELSKMAEAIVDMPVFIAAMKAMDDKKKVPTPSSTQG